MELESEIRSNWNPDSGKKQHALGFTQMLSGGNEDEVPRLATDHGWLDASGQLTAAGDQLARALVQQNGTRTVFRIW
jgi:hypothetical protein